MKIQDIYKNEMGEYAFFRSIFGQKAYSDKYIKWLEERATEINRSCPLYTDYQESCQALKDHKAILKREK